MVHGCMMYTERAEMAVSLGKIEPYVTIKQRCKHTTSVNIQNAV